MTREAATKLRDEAKTRLDTGTQWVLRATPGTLVDHLLIAQWTAGA